VCSSAVNCFDFDPWSLGLDFHSAVFSLASLSVWGPVKPRSPSPLEFFACSLFDLVAIPAQPRLAFRCRSVPAFFGVCVSRAGRAPGARPPGRFCFSQQPSPGPTVLASSSATLIVYDQPLGSAPVLPLYSSSLPVSACSCSSSMPPATDLVFPRLGSGIDLRSGLLLTHFIFLSFSVRLTALARLFPNRFLAEELSWIHLSRAGFLLFLSLCGVLRCEFKPSPFQHTNGEARPASLVFGS
jgi:hypothetical protein